MRRAYKQAHGDLKSLSFYLLLNEILLLLFFSLFFYQIFIDLFQAMLLG